MTAKDKEKYDILIDSLTYEDDISKGKPGERNNGDK
jgi:hypothetical protein